MCSQKTPRKNDLKASNISVKKYHQRPGLGVRSGRESGVRYREWRNVKEGRMRRERARRRAVVAKKGARSESVKANGVGVVADIDCTALPSLVAGDELTLRIWS